MPDSAYTMRRWLGLLFLALAFGLMVWGQVVLRDKLTGLPFLVYWFCCFLFTIAAVVVALIDFRATRRQAREEHADLIARTLQNIERDPGEDGK